MPSAVHEMAVGIMEPSASNIHTGLVSTGRDNQNIGRSPKN